MIRCHPLSVAIRCLVVSASLIVACYSSLITAFAQSATATLSGTVEDANGAVIPGVTITVTNNGTGAQRQTTTNDEGYFVVPLLPPSRYQVTAQNQGFTTVRIPEVVLNISDQKALQIRLNAGDINATVQVTSEAPLIDTSSAVGTVVDRQFVANIPLNGRSFQSLLTLTPGVVLVPAGTSLNQGQFSVNGQRADANSFMVDGVSANFGTSPVANPNIQTSGSLPGFTAFGTTQSLVSVDALQEFKVQTSSYSAEYGRQPGGQISIVTRSGTNQFHGSAFDYLRNDIFDANDWFANRAKQPKPPERQNDFGGTLGGPVVIPGLYDGHNRTFFFFSYEGLRLRQPKFALTNVPTLCLRGKGSCMSGQSAASAGIQPVLNAFPLPNGKDLGNGLAEFSAGYSDPSSLDSTSIRIDHAFSSKLTIFARYSGTPSESKTRSDSQALSRLIVSAVRTRTITVGTTATVTSRLINEFRINYTDNFGSTATPLDNFGGATPPPVSALIPDQFLGTAAQSLVTLNIPGNTAGAVIGQVGNKFILSQRQLNIVDSASWKVGSHQIKYGLDYRRLSPTVSINSYLLLPTFSSQQEVLNATAGSGLVLVGTPAKPEYANFSAYGQDTWNVSRRLTLNLGVRWDVNPAPSEANGKDPLAVTEVTNLATMQLAPLGAKQWKTTYHNFAPRFGIVYQVSQAPGRETVVRGGGGMFYDVGNNQGSTSIYNGFPFSASRTLSNIAYPLSPAQVAPPSLPDRSNLSTPYGTLSVFDPHLNLPYTLQWNVAIDQSLGKNQLATLSYVGAAGRQLLQRRQLRLSVLNPSFTTILLTTNNATSDYDALQMKFQRRLSNGVQALASYTWSHALDEDSVDNGTIIPVRGNAAFDVRHIVAAAVTYDIPAPLQNHFLAAVLGHWSVDSSVHAQTAPPVDITGSQFVNPADGTLVAARANVVPGVPFYIDDPIAPGGRKINRAAFSIPTTGQFGNFGRNQVRGLGAWQIDAAFRRQLRLTERVNLQFRAEAFNLLNHPNFGAIQTSLSAPNFGQATSMLGAQLGGISQLYQIGGPRSFQFALKLIF